jgi:hypothetical protein
VTPRDDWGRMAASLRVRLEERSGCWVVTSVRPTREGYVAAARGPWRIKSNGDRERSLVQLHRLALVVVGRLAETDLVWVNPMPVVDHICRVRSCVNPDHLDLVPNRTNILRGVGTAAIRARRTHCPKGHPLTEDNIAPDQARRGKRSCWACVRDRTAERAVILRSNGLTQSQWNALRPEARERMRAEARA